MKVKSDSEVAQLCPTLSDPKDCSPPGSSIHGIFQVSLANYKYGGSHNPEISIMMVLNTGCGEGNGTPLQFSCLENPMDGGAW